eukprot:CAMPEP_0119527026 /NCGR_PEP_ID=MMETSP1344-20130328/41539_1 /TAXON_ID=236787 /ORGANISM="Florenciella parvula, Strain CCMP2471" /LENGTH=74 /DNA_ID=CAMNT_0007566159 /DNA_START=17 /DNA_END=241 /DNA_ORIENTATION=+
MRCGRTVRTDDEGASRLGELGDILVRQEKHEDAPCEAMRAPRVARRDALHGIVELGPDWHVVFVAQVGHRCLEL